MNSRFRNWSDVRVFLAVLREGSTLAASRKLGVAQPTVSRRIEVFEHEMGMTLFTRDTRGFRPTEHALALAPLAETMERAAQELHAKAMALTQPRPIRITAYSGNFSPRVNAIFSAFSALRPDVRFEFLPGVKVLDLIAGEADIALRHTRSEPDPHLICRRISTAEVALYGSHLYASKHGLPRSADELDKHVFVTFEREDVSVHLHHWLAERVSGDQIRMSFGEIDLMHAAVRAGHGLGLINVRLAENDDTLIRCFDPIRELSSSHLMLIAPDAYRRPEVKEFTKFFAPRYAAIFS